MFIIYRFPKLILKRILKYKKPNNPKKILIIHQLFLGDTLMTTSLLAKIRKNFPTADIYYAMPEVFIKLYSTNPYGVVPVGFNVFKWKTFLNLLKLPKFDWAIIPGDNRYGWTAFAIGAKWITGFAGDTPRYKNWCFDELKSIPNIPQSWSDILTNLVEGIDPDPFNFKEWPQPSYKPFKMPPAKYVLLHIGAKSRLKLWDNQKWKKIIEYLKQYHLKIALSCGPNEKECLNGIDINDPNIFLYPGNLDLVQMWELIKKACLLISVDNGIAHLSKIIGTPTICLFGPASAILFDKGRFWQYCPFLSISKPIKCRNQNKMFKRNINWIQTCQRLPHQCSEAKCMEIIEVEDITNAAEFFIKKCCE
ncbi:glycosyltransferase family 9 protein [Thermodesulfovibrio sp. 3462-1]|uniref:Glycosyltransferase family 9 protein n=1 Tax=Thermodesulfovibrio obliviosus TaxID=3118332 RepID=A0AAU8H402_9BACT